jgi:hypothetical protein
MPYFKKILTSTCFIYLILLELFVCTKPSYAYLDPGIISALLQMLAAGIFGAIITIKIWWSNVKLYLSNYLNYFYRKKKTKKNKN